MRLHITILNTLLTYALICGYSFPVLAADTYTFSTITAAPHETFTNSNWNSIPHPQVATFTINASGDAYGYTENGIYFSQYTIPNTLGIRIQRFDMEEYHHFIIEGTVVYSLEAFSAELALAYSAHSAV